jgi:hypothetical protein
MNPGALFALRRAIEDKGDDETAYRALRFVDPLLRGRAKQKLGAAIREALYATQLPTTGPEGNRHILALSYLCAAQQAHRVSPDDAAAVFHLYQELTRAPLRAARWWPSLFLGLLLLGASLGLWRWATAPKEGLNPDDALSRSAPAPAGAFLHGGTPSAEASTLEQALARELPAYIIALDRQGRARHEGASESILAQHEAEIDAIQKRLVENAVARELGPAASAALREVLAQAANVSQRAILPKNDPFLGAVAACNDAFAAANLGYFLDGDIITSDGHTFAILYAFAVENVSVFSTQGRTIRALTLRRLDNLNFSRAALGLARPELRDAILQRDEIDTLLVTEILPGLVEGATVPLVDDETRALNPEWLGASERLAGEMIRAEYAPKLSAEAVLVGQRLQRRAAIFASTQARIEERGLRLSLPEGLAIDEGFYLELAGIIPEEEMEELKAIQRDLTSEAAVSALQSARRLVAASVERHEVQHRLDFSLPEPLPLPVPLEYLVGPLLRADGEARPVAEHARDELSAYLGELARDPFTVRVNLVLLSRFLLHRNQWGTVECNAALVIFRELSGALGQPVPELLSQGSVDRALVVSLLQTFTQKNPDELRKAAAQAYQKLFGVPLPEMKRVSPEEK